MTQDLISKKTRNALRELLVGWVLREIGMAFEEMCVECDRSYEPQTNGERRTFVEQHYHTLDFAKVGDAKRILDVMEDVIGKTHRKMVDQQDIDADQKLDVLFRAMNADGFAYKDGKIRPTSSATRKAFGHILDCSISEVTRRNVVDNLNGIQGGWAGRLSESAFLKRLYDLEALPSRDARFKNALGDIIQHRENNLDWEEDWVFADERFSLMESDDAFLRFLCEMIHPVVRTDGDEVCGLLKLFNDHLCKDGWEIHKHDYISGKPVFKFRRASSANNAIVNQVRIFTEMVDSIYIAKQIARMTNSVENDPELAIGTAKELVETVCKTILHERDIPFSKNADLLELNKVTLKALRLVPDDIPDHAKGAEIIKRMLSNLAAVTHGLAELRNLYGTGHGRHGQTKSIQPRHALLAVGAVSTLVTFLHETHSQDKTKKEPTIKGSPDA